MLHQQWLDTTTPAGKAMFQMMGVFAEFERAMIRERRFDGWRSRSSGRQIDGGRCWQAVEVGSMAQNGDRMVADVSAAMECAEATTLATNDLVGRTLNHRCAPRPAPARRARRRKGYSDTLLRLETRRHLLE
jgi:hypothetical protein